jgi:hypothetical protein
VFKWQSFLDNSRMIYANEHCSDQIVQQIQEGRDPVRIDIPGRKETENDTSGRYYTYIGKDAMDALTTYFEEERGWPKKGEAIWLQSNRRHLQKATMEALWLRLTRKICKVSRRKGPLGSRYGFNLHEFRDAAATYLYVHAKPKGLEMDCVKFWSGRVGEIDPHRYIKFYQDPGFVQKQYQIAESFLNIASGTPADQEIEKITSGFGSFKAPIVQACFQQCTHEPAPLILARAETHCIRVSTGAQLSCEQSRQ